MICQPDASTCHLAACLIRTVGLVSCVVTGIPEDTNWRPLAVAEACRLDHSLVSLSMYLPAGVFSGFSGARKHCGSGIYCSLKRGAMLLEGYTRPIMNAIVVAYVGPQRLPTQLD